MLDQTAVQPIDESTAAVPPTEEESPAATESPIADEVLKIPAITALLAGKPAAISARIKEFKTKPEAKAIVANKSGLEKLGMGFYRSLSGNVGVIFNQMAIHPEAIKQADKAGKLLEVAPPFDQVNQQIGASAPPEGQAGAGGLAQPPPANPPQSMQAPMPAAAQRDLMKSRVMQLQPQAATKGPVAGQGNLLKSILKPVL